MMKKFLLAVLFLLALVPAGFAQVEVLPQSWEPFIGTDPIDGVSLVGKGYARYSVTTAVTLATAPAAGAVIHRTAKHAIINVEVGQIRVRFDGTDPTASEGQLIDTGEKITLENQRSYLLALRMISVSGTATVTVVYGR
jgi:hypothetical protein